MVSPLIVVSINPPKPTRGLDALSIQFMNASNRARKESVKKFDAGKLLVLTRGFGG